MATLLIMYNTSVILPSGYSPVTLNQEWSRLTRFLIVSLGGCFGIVLNSLFISSFCVQPSLVRKGNVYQCCVGVADIIVICTICPPCWVLLLSGQEDNLFVCKVMQFTIETANIWYSLSYMLISFENYLWICRDPKVYKKFIKLKPALVSIIVLAIAMGMATAGVVYELDYDYCRRLHLGMALFRLAGYVFLHAVPCVFTVIYFAISWFSVKRRSRIQPYYRRSRLYDRDRTIIRHNIVAYLMFIIFWIPFLVVVLWFPFASDATFYLTATLGVFRTLLTSSYFGLASRLYRSTYSNLCRYCCCKSAMSRNRLCRRHRRSTAPALEMCDVERGSTRGELRTHILHRYLINRHRSATRTCSRTAPRYNPRL